MEKDEGNRVRGKGMKSRPSTDDIPALFPGNHFSPLFLSFSPPPGITAKGEKDPREKAKNRRKKGIRRRRRVVKTTQMMNRMPEGDKKEEEDKEEDIT